MKKKFKFSKNTTDLIGPKK